MEPAPAVRNRGSGPTLILSVTLLVFGSTRLTRLFSVLLTHTALSSPKTHENEPDGTSISADTVFVTGSILERMPFLSVSIHMLPNPDAKPEHGRLPTSMARTTLLVFVSRR